jgi:thiamine pyrophosphate-dependent acetolactate synthase large subunit-like protein
MKENSSLETCMTASDVLVESLMDWGVEVVFGLPGDGINGVMEALRTRPDKIRFVQVRHEESAAFMACGYAKVTGKLGVCLATSGPGGIHLLNGLYDAKLDEQPVLAITGLQFHDLIGTFTQQDVALDKLYMDVAVFNETVMGAGHVENLVDLACRTALAYRGVAHLTIPVDFQEHEGAQTLEAKCTSPHVKGAGFLRGVTQYYRSGEGSGGAELREKGCHSCRPRRFGCVQRSGTSSSPAWSANRESTSRQSRRP